MYFMYQYSFINGLNTHFRISKNLQRHFSFFNYLKIFIVETCVYVFEINVYMCLLYKQNTNIMYWFVLFFKFHPQT